ncbi:hypothetical protein HBB16_05285 [Pseudonocardia sp. MCCB 268]|nr:hypothetical protein [Pseudonocardia cytotoxica]
MTTLGSGADHEAVLAGGELVLRRARGVLPGAGTGEAALLARSARGCRFRCRSSRFAAGGVLAYELPPGRPLLGRQVSPGTAGAPGRSCACCMDSTSSGCRWPWPRPSPRRARGPDGPAELLAGCAPTCHRRAAAHARACRPRGRASARTRRAPHRRPDWSDAAITDPALDLARPYRDFGPEF